MSTERPDGTAAAQRLRAAAGDQARRLRTASAHVTWSARRLAGRSAGPSPEVAERAAAVLRDEVRALPPLETTGEIDLWNQKRNEVRRLILEGDVRAFLSWDPLVQTMVVGNAGYVGPELRALRAAPDWEARWRPAIREDETGFPPPFTRYPTSSGNAIHMAHHVLVWERASGRTLSELGTILEFGGGYGAFARAARRLGFAGTHHVHDLPEFGALQRYFLTCTLGEDLTAGEGPSRIVLSDDFERAQATAASAEPKLFVATWSLSETPLALREQWEPVLASFQHLLLGYQHTFEGIDNVRWFGELAERRPDLVWTTEQVPTLGGNAYLIGRPR